MRQLKVNVTIEDTQSNEILIITGDLNVLRDLVSGAKLILPKLEEADSVDLNQFLDDVDAKVNPLNPKYRTQAQDLYDRYVEWCADNGHRPQSSTKLAREWVKLGFQKAKINGLNFWTGVQLPTE